MTAVETGGGMFQHTKRVLVTTRICTVAKNDPCADVSQKYRKIYLMDEAIQTDDFKPADVQGHTNVSQTSS